MFKRNHSRFLLNDSMHQVFETVLINTELLVRTLRVRVYDSRSRPYHDAWGSVQVFFVLFIVRMEVTLPRKLALFRVSTISTAKKAAYISSKIVFIFKKIV